MPVKKKNKTLKKLRRKLTRPRPVIAAIALLAVGLIKLYRRSLKLEIHHHPDAPPPGSAEPFLLGLWHGRQFLLLASQPQYNFAILTDTSWAGLLQAQILKRLGYLPIQGSSKHSPTKALLSLKRAMDQGYSAAFALDGPNGPKEQSKPGILFLGKKTGNKIIPATSASSNHWTLSNTWCDFQIPKPFSHCIVHFGQPLSPEITPEELSEEVCRLSDRCERSLC